jgi:hypothetical protein
VSHADGRNRLPVLMHSLLRKIFGTKRGKVTVDWRRLHSKELHDVLLTKYRPGDQIKNNEVGMAGVGRGEMYTGLC